MTDEARCPQCGTPYTPSDAPSRCEQCGADLPPAVPAEAPPPLGIETWFEGSAPPWSPPPPIEPPPLPAIEPPPLPPVVETPQAAPDLILLEEPLAEIKVAPPPQPEVPVMRPTAKRASAAFARVAPPVARLDDLPEARPTSRRESRPTELVRPLLPPVRESAPPEVPKPRVYLALLVLFAMFVAAACGMTVIGYAIWAGFKAAAKPKAEVPAMRQGV